MSEFHHVSVLLQECIDGLNIRPDGIYVDGTLGGAGHSSQIAKRLTTGRLIGIDRDPVALKAASERLAPYMDRVTLVHSNFCEIASVLQKLNISGSADLERKVSSIVGSQGVCAQRCSNCKTSDTTRKRFRTWSWKRSDIYLDRIRDNLISYCCIIIECSV